ncbi:MAG: glycosyltransferase family 2 protein [Planctomycetota bacterium]
MDSARFVITLVLLLVAIGAAVYWSAFVVQLWRTLASTPSAEDGLELDLGPEPGPLCVVIPAHNEEEVIGPLVDSLRAQTHPSFRVVLALDRCTDQTEAIARERIGDDARFRIVDVRPGGEGWAGKVNAVWCGVLSAPEAHRASYLLFSDADCVFHPGCLASTTALVDRHGLDMLSLVNQLTSDRWFERLVQPAAGLELLTQYPLRRANRERERRAFANGQFMLFRASAYRRLGGHPEVADELLEDLAIARQMADREMRQWTLPSGKLVTTRMYRSWDAFRRGWKRIFIEGAHRKPARLSKDAWQLRASSSVLPIGAALGAGWWALGGVFGTLAGNALGVVALAALAMWAIGVGTVYRLGGYPVSLTPGHVVGAWLVGGLLKDAARDLREGNPVRWGGRRYVRAVR